MYGDDVLCYDRYEVWDRFCSNGINRQIIIDKWNVNDTKAYNETANSERTKRNNKKSDGYERRLGREI
jgi:hypothetical protein